MMDILLIALSLLAIAATLAAAVLAYKLRLARTAVAEGVCADPADALRKELEMLGSTGVGMGQRLDRVAADLRALQSRLEQLETRDPGSNAYAHAIRMAERGKDVDELMDVLGVSRAEAELIRKLHPQSPPARH